MEFDKEIDFYDILLERDEYVIVPSKNGSWIKSEDFTELMNAYMDSKFTIEDLKLKNQQLEETIKSLVLKKRMNIIRCPRCKQVIDNDDMRRKHCHICHHEWEVSEGY